MSPPSLYQTHPYENDEVPIDSHMSSFGDIHDTEMQGGIAKVEAAQAVWGKTSRWVFLFG